MASQLAAGSGQTPAQFELSGISHRDEPTDPTNALSTIMTPPQTIQIRKLQTRLSNRGEVSDKGMLSDQDSLLNQGLSPWQLSAAR